MITFWIIAVLLLVATLFFLLPPLLKKGAGGVHVDRDNLNVLLYKDQLTELKADVKSGVITQAEYDQAQQDLERRLLQDVSGDSVSSKGSSGDVIGKRTAAVVVVLIPLVTISIYMVRGAGEMGLNPQMAKANIQAEGHDGNIDEQLLTLQKHLKEKPDDAEGWLVLARTKYYVKDYKSASEAFAQTVRLSNESDAQLLADYADALAMASGRVLAGKPMELVNKALAIQPNHQKGLWLAATYAYETKDYAATEKYWNELLVQFAEGSKEYLQMLNNIGEARSLQGLSTDDVTAKIAALQNAAATAGSSSGSSSGPASVSGEVKLDPNLLANIAPTDTLFIFARAESGPRMPLAIIRTTVSELPLKFTLDDSSAMRPEMKLSKFKRVVVGARISKSGNAMPQDGDLKGSTAVIAVGSNNLSIVINDVVGATRSPPPTMTEVTSSSAKVSGTVDIDEGLRSRVSPTDTLYIFARAASGPRMPLAIIKSQVSALPFDFSLDDSLAMSPQMKLSKFKDVIVTARISKSGNAMPQQGDLKGSTSVIKVGSEGLKIIIDSAVP